MNTRLQPLMQAMGYTFRDPELLEHALTHSSYANEGKARHSSNERLEFLGDSVLGFITADYLFAHDKGAEGELTKRRASLVCEKALSGYAQTLKLGDFLLLGKGERMTGGAAWFLTHNPGSRFMNAGIDRSAEIRERILKRKNTKSS